MTNNRKVKGLRGQLFFSKTWDFLNVYLARQAKRSLDTIESYRDSFTIFKNYLTDELGKSIGTFQFSECTKDCIYNFREYLLEKGSKPSTVNVTMVDAQGIEIPESVHCHMFRRTCATNLYQDGVTIDLVSTVLGHARTDTTKSYYAKPSIEQLREAMESVPNPASEEIPLWDGNEEEMARMCGISS